LIASGEPGTDALPMHADARVFAGRLAAGATVTQALTPGRVAYLVPAKGTLTVNGVAVGARDGAAVSGETALTITATEDAELVLVETDA
jgi:redox-sensitive bicupin YhaK (pirin superfamily)